MDIWLNSPLTLQAEKERRMRDALILPTVEETRRQNLREWAKRGVLLDRYGDPANAVKVDGLELAQKQALRLAKAYRKRKAARERSASPRVRERDREAKRRKRAAQRAAVAAEAAE